MHVDVAMRARGVTPRAALAWWTDFQDGRGDHRFVPLQTRRILSRDHESVVMEDRLPLFFFRERTVAHVHADRVDTGGPRSAEAEAQLHGPGLRVEFEGVNTYSTFRGAYHFEPRGPDSTRVRLVADIRLKRAIRPGEGLVAPLVRTLLRADLRHHVREMERAAAAR